ncbi:MAG TPA: hypothetical protein PK200_13755, partial [Spirochaetota bacterium]|nr:hypothetical protein [Spirochaetota bacterium]
MKEILVEDLKPGMRFDKPVYIDSSNMLVGANVSIKESDIKKLMKWGVASIETAGALVSTDADLKLEKRIETFHPVDVNAIVQNYNNLLRKRRNLIEVHRRACTEVEKVHSAIKTDQKFTTEGLEEALDGIIRLMGESSNIFLFLYGLDEGKNTHVVHSVNVTFYSILIGIALKYTPEKLGELGLAGDVHGLRHALV